MSIFLRLTVAVTAVLIAWVGLSMPAAPLQPESAAGDGSVPGVIHIHTSRSDGGSPPDVVAEAAARAGLKFIILTDHGDGTRQPDPPAYRSGVLVIDAVEISTDAGHIVALNLPRAPYPLGGEARDVLADVHRLGGRAVAAHPDSPKAELTWQDWEIPLDGVELVNLDTAWRKRAAGDWSEKFRLFRAASTYPWRPAPSIATLMGESPELVARWSALARVRPLAIFGGADAHARLDLRQSTGDERPVSLSLPSYEAVFRTMSTRVTTAEALDGDAVHDAAQVLDALVAGHAYLVFDAVLTPPAFTFEARSEARTVQQGDSLTTASEVTLVVKTNAPLPFKAVLFKDGEAIQEASGAVEPTWTVSSEPAVYRVEIRATDRDPSALWVMSNPIYVNLSPAVPGTPPLDGSATAPRPGGDRRVLFGDTASGTWTTEAASTSKAALNTIELPTGGRELLFRYGLPGGKVTGQYAAAVVNTSGGIEPFRELSLRVRAEKPMRLSLQLRQEGGTEGWRWQRTVYVDDREATHRVPFSELRPMGRAPTPGPPAEHVSSILLAVDQTNTAPGSSGRVWIREVVLH